MQTGYIGTYNSAAGRGIYSFKFDEQTGKLSGGESFYAADDAKCVALHGDKLFITLSHEGKGGTAVLNAATGQLQDAVLEEHKTPCFIKYENGFIYTANYHDGTVMVYRLQNFALELVKRIDIMPKAGCHQVITHGNYIIVPCLLLDELRIFDAHSDFELVKTISFTKGTGPRHGVFNAAHTKFYLVSELTSELFVFDVKNLSFELQSRTPLLNVQQAAESATAAIRLSKDEQRLYISTRGADLLTVISFNEMNQPCFMQQTSCGGSHPRDFLLSDDEKYLLCVNRDSDDLISFALDSDGKIGAVADTLTVPHGVGIALQ